MVDTLIKTFFTSPDLSNLLSIKHAFFTKNLPGNTNRYLFADEEIVDSHKFETSPLKKDIIRRNRTIAMEHFGLRHSNLSILKQTHSNKVVYTTAPQEMGKEIEADGQVTTAPGVALGVLTADCVPVLFADNKARVIGAAHAGWRGALSGVLENTVKEMVNNGASSNNIIAAIGPCIHQDAYEISQEFFEEFLQENENNNRFFIPSKNKNHFMFDLPGYVKDKLANLELKKISDIERDTFTEEAHFLSYRSWTKDANKPKGTILSVIMISNRVI